MGFGFGSDFKAVSICEESSTKSLQSYFDELPSRKISEPK